MSELAELRQNDYQRLFKLRGGIYFLLSDIFADYYRNLECFLTCLDKVWTSHIPKKVVEQTLAQGLDLLRSSEKFGTYKKDFDEYKTRSSDFFDTLLKKEKLEKEEARQAFGLITENWVFYSKTEFFYTDKAYMELGTNPSPELLRNIEEFEEVKTSGREHMNKLIFTDGYAERLIEKLSQQFNVPVETLRTCKMEEVLSLFENGAPSQKAVAERSQAFIQYAKDGKISYVEGEEAAEGIKKFSEESMDQSPEITGMVANKGKAKGRVKVIPTDYYSNFNILKTIFSEMEDGSVLVAETTSPELMPACRKANAIVTDQGGLLSHAAIVSRELGIPCIVGTGNATEILKDGDMVEVDADKGIVRIIKT